MKFGTIHKYVETSNSSVYLKKISKNSQVIKILD